MARHSKGRVIGHVAKRTPGSFAWVKGNTVLEMMPPKGRRSRHHGDKRKGSRRGSRRR